MRQAISDRFCIVTGRNKNVIISFQDLVSCDQSDLGYQGGYLDQSLQYLFVADDCFPFTFGSWPVAACPTSGICKKGIEKIQSF